MEELRDSPQSVLSRSCEFLGVSPEHQFVGQAEARNTGDFYQAPGLIRWAAGNATVRSLARFVLPSGLHQPLRSTLGRFSHGKERLGRWRLNEQEMQQVLRVLADDLRRLRDVYEVDVERSWSIPASLIA